ncbi:unnamed protein product [Paramecium sonneborni]|uniref:Uncharacterized protein n=1 Tax=Paramecium sonneborni TaxID=65129 RepID=A0A8S1RP75_9CILI|nr:unnamed protein product [Paramecium sonneborni]
MVAITKDDFKMNKEIHQRIYTFSNQKIQYKEGFKNDICHRKVALIFKETKQIQVEYEYVRFKIDLRKNFKDVLIQNKKQVIQKMEQKKQNLKFYINNYLNSLGFNFKLFFMKMQSVNFSKKISILILNI